MNISKHTKAELLEALRGRYRGASKQEKSRILDEFVAVTGYHRKHAVRLLGARGEPTGSRPATGRRIYDEAVKEALILLWEASDRICSKRLRAILPDLVDAMERHGHLDLAPLVRQRLLSISAATIDRLLSSTREQAGQRKKRRPKKKKASKQVAVRTFADWNEPAPGFLEIDFVVHCGGSMAGAYIHTLVATDVCSGWTEYLPLLAREQSLVVEGLTALGKQFPFPVLGIDTDNDGAFINDTVVSYCQTHGIEFTRSRPYRKNDQAWVEQKNGAIIRRFVGHHRFSGVVAGQALAHLYHALRRYVNYFQPSFKLLSKVRDGAKVRKSYHKPATPFERVSAHPATTVHVRENLLALRQQLDPVDLLHRIRDSQAALAALASPEDHSTGPGRVSLEQFLSQLPQLWRTGEARPTHRQATSEARTWRTREDPFVGVWAEVLRWLQEEPDVPAKTLLDRLQDAYPEQFSDGHLRTLQRRVREWRQIMAKELVYACIGKSELP